MTRSIWAIGDLHLSFGTPNKEMDRFGPEWKDHADAVKRAWDASIAPDDLVLIPGDISWAMRLSGALPDLEWIGQRPGIKVLIRGNHDYWWGSISQVRAALPPTVHAINNDVFSIDGIAVAGARLWDSSTINCGSVIQMRPTGGPMEEKEPQKDEEIFRRELGRLEMSLKQLPKDASLKIGMTHYPPIGLDLQPSQPAALFEQYGVQIAVFGHLHSFKEGLPPLFGTARGVRYVLCSCDYLKCTPTRIV